MSFSSDPKPGTSSQSGSVMNSIGVFLDDQPKQGPNKLDQLTSEQIDSYISSETLAQYEFSGDRHLLVYDKNQIEYIAPSSADGEDVGDEFFELSKGEAQRLLRDIIRTRDQLENGQLMTKAMRDLNSAKRTLATLHQYSYSVVRLHLPSGHVLQALFKPLENIGKVKAYFKQYLVDPDLDFYIYFTPPKSILQDSSTLLDLRCVPTANFYFSVQDERLTPSGHSQNESLPLVNNTTGIEVRITSDKNEDSMDTSESSNENKPTGISKERISDKENDVKMSDKEVQVKNEAKHSVAAGTDLAGDTQSCDGTCSASRSQSSQVTSTVLCYVREDVLKTFLVARSVADLKAAEFRRARNPTLNFLEDPDLGTSTSCSNSPSQQLTPAVPKSARPRTSQDKIPKWFKPGGK